MVTKDLGMVTAYAYAVAGGYTGTEAEFTQLMADLAVVVDDFDNFSVNVTTLPAGSSATASYADGVLSLGIPKGDKGDKGNTGDTGAPAGFGTVSATVDANIGTPSVEVTASGSDTAKNFAFAFHNLKGQKGDKGDTGEVSEAELAEALEDFAENGTVANAEQLTTKIRANDQTPYIFRTSGGSVDIGDREYINGIVGGTIAWNQLVLDANKDAKNTSTVDTRTNFQLAVQSVYQPILAPLTVASVQVGEHAYVFKVTSDIGTGIRIKHNGSSTDLLMYVNTNISMQKDHVYMFKANFVGVDVQTIEGVDVRNMQLFDLTQMFGSTIANYIYALEAANEGAGISWFRKHFPKPYYTYNAGELMSVKGLVSHDMVGFNAFDKSTMVVDGYYIIDTTGSAVAKEDAKCTDFIPVVGGMSYYINTEQTSAAWGAWYDANKNFIGPCTAYYKNSGTQLKTAPSNACYIKLTMVYGNNNGNVDTFCINLSWDGSEDGNYEPYQKWSYPLDTDLELRGIPKLDASNNLYYDGDVYEPDGTVTRKYGIVDLGTLNWSKIQYGEKVLFYADNSSQAQNTRDYLCPKYTVANNISGINDKQITGAGGTGTSIWVRDDSYTDTTALKTAMSGVYLVYELATPTTESADPYTNPQIVNDFGTEEWVLDSDVFPMPVGHNTDYPIDLKAQVEMMPHSPDGDGDYIVRQTNGTNEYVAFANNATIQNILARLEALEG